MAIFVCRSWKKFIRGSRSNRILKAAVKDNNGTLVKQLLAARIGNLGMLTDLWEKHSNHSALLAENLIWGGSCGGHIEIIQWIDEKFDICKSLWSCWEYPFLKMIKNGQLDALRYLREKWRKEPDGLEDIKCKQDDIIEWIHSIADAQQHDSEVWMTWCCFVAIVYKNFKYLEFYAELGIHRMSIMYQVVVYGDKEVLDWMKVVRQRD